MVILQDSCNGIKIHSMWAINWLADFILSLEHYFLIKLIELKENSLILKEVLNVFITKF